MDKKLTVQQKRIIRWGACIWITALFSAGFWQGKANGWVTLVAILVATMVALFYEIKDVSKNSIDLDNGEDNCSGEH